MSKPCREAYEAWSEAHREADPWDYWVASWERGYEEGYEDGLTDLPKTYSDNDPEAPGNAGR